MRVRAGPTVTNNPVDHVVDASFDLTHAACVNK